MNEYTRREEIFWTLVTVCILVPAVAVSVVRLVKANGPMVPNPLLVQAKADAHAAVDDYKNARCTDLAKKLGEDAGVLKQAAAKAEQQAKSAQKGKPAADKSVEYTIRWQPAQSVLKKAKALQQASCRSLTTAAVTGSAARAWNAVDKAAPLKEAADEKTRQDTARQLLELFKDDKDLAALSAQTEAAKRALDDKAAAADGAAADPQKYVQDKLPEGLFPRGAAIGVGVAIALAALIISYLSVRSASLRRARLLIALRRFANTPEAGLQAAAIVRLAAHHNGGEPGMVLGSALGGLLAALLAPTNNPNVFIADLFVAGSMGGLLVGLAGQWLARTLQGVARWRDRTKELGDVEKPTIPVALILGGVTQGLEKQFLRYFEALPISDAAVVVQKLAAQAEEQILAAADAAAQQQAAASAAGAGQWGAGPGM